MKMTDSLLEEREEILSELADFKQKVVIYERKIEVGELINIKDLENHPKFVALLKERNNLISIINGSTLKDNTPPTISKKISYAEIIKNGIGKVAITNKNTLDLSNAVINKTNPGIRIASIFKKKSINGNSNGNTRPFDQYKLINIKDVDIASLQEKLTEENFGHQVKVSKVYTVTGDHSTYRNAIMIVDMNTAAKIEQYPYLYFNKKSLRVFEFFNLRQCTK